MQVLYLIFNEGYTASSGDRLVRAEVRAEAIRLGRLLAALMPDEAEILGLLALMLLVESRRAARTSPDGDLVLLADQDRGRWDRGSSPKARPSSGAACGATGPARARSRRRSTPSTATRRPRPPRTGGRSCDSTTSSWRSPRARSWPSIAPSRWPRSRGRRRSPSSTAST
jgi:hypothetical protein